MARKPRIRTKLSRQELPKNFFSVFKKEAEVLANKTTRKAADRTLERAKEIIENQEFSWKPLSPEYRKKKKKKGLDLRIFVATKEYLNKGIGTWESGRRIFVGPKQGIHKPSGLTYRVLSRILEFGTWSIPSRPLWRPLASQILREIPGFRREYQKGVQRASKKAASRKRTVKR